MTNRPTTDRSNRMEAIVTETQDEDLNKPATIGTVRMLAVHADAGFAQVNLGLERLSDRIESVEKNLDQRIEYIDDNLTQKIEHVEEKLTQRIDAVENNLTQKIEHSVIEIKAEIALKISTVIDQLALRTSSDRFIKVGFAVAVLGILFQTVFIAMK